MNPWRIGFIGVGLMGHGMAKNLVEKGFPTTVLGNRNRVPVEDLVQRGATEGRDPASVAESADIVVICVTGSPQVEAIIEGPKGVLASARDGLIVMDCSTSEPDSTARLGAALAAKGATLVDAPLARTPKEAAEGRLNVMVGAEPAVFDCVEPVLKAFAENIFHVGGPGAGHKTKLVNNFLGDGSSRAHRGGAGGRRQGGARPRSLRESGFSRRRELGHLPDGCALGSRRHL
jgi:3-hydroxyisobutyrate dehydrogenase-like beta-hydroxyacid dehydrogenase